jgi:hypothetical protein
MKPHTHILKCLPAMLLVITAAGPLPLCGAPTAQPAKLEIKPSVFDIPSNASQGRDPFFPASMRVFTSVPQSQMQAPALTELTLKSILGTPPHVYAIINNHTFASGDDEDVMTKSGQRLHIYCVNINPNAGTATVEANNASQVLHLSEGL